MYNTLIFEMPALTWAPFESKFYIPEVHNLSYISLFQSMTSSRAARALGHKDSIQTLIYV